MVHTLRKKNDSPGERQRRIYTFLRNHPVGVLSTITPDNNPHGVVVYFVASQDFTIQILTKTGTHKYDNLKHNSHVMLTVFDPDTQSTAQITGITSEQPDHASIQQVASGIIEANTRTSGSLLPPILKLQAGKFTSFRIDPVQIRVATYAHGGYGDYSELFESLESFELKQF
jgi:uncharacterized protein YhbP (UPF0306 family)